MKTATQCRHRTQRKQPGFNGLLELLEKFFEGENVEVYKLITEPAWVDEFAWNSFSSNVATRFMY